MNYGLLEIAEDIKDYILGASKVPFIPYIYYNESGDWGDALPKFEKQRTKDGSETSACTVFASINQIETFIKFVYGYEPNYSERFTYNLVPIEPSKGADPQRTHEAIRANGLIDEKDLPMTRTLADYLDTSDITGSLLAKGQNWLLKHDYKHEWVWESGERPENYIEVLRDALKTSPIAVSVSAWNEVNGVYVSNQGSVNNHYCLLYKIDDEGYPWVFDTYDYSKKKLAKDHNIRRAKRIWVNELRSKSMKKHISLLKLILNKLMQKETLLDVCEKYLGKDASPKNQAKSELACAETVSFLLRQVYPEVPEILGTWVLYDYLKKSTNNFIQLKGPEAGCVAVAPTGTGKKGTIGHTWIVFEDGTWGSNNSFGIYKGLFTKNYTYETAKKRYVDTQGMEIFFFKHI